MSESIKGGNLNVAGFPNCCGLKIHYGFSSSFGDGQSVVMPNEYDLRDMMIEKPKTGASLLALTHEQWKTVALLKQLHTMGYKPILSDFFNANTSRQITLFAKVYYPEQKGNSKAWQVAKTFFGKK